MKKFKSDLKYKNSSKKRVFAAGSNITSYEHNLREVKSKLKLSPDERKYSKENRIDGIQISSTFIFE